jgi:hypothetical protein
MAVHRKGFDRYLVLLATLLLLLATICFTNGLPAVHRGIALKRSSSETATIVASCESTTFDILDLELEAIDKTYSGDRWFDRKVLFEMEQKYFEEKRLRGNYIVRKSNTTCMKQINTSHDNCRRSDDYVADNLHSLVNGKPYMLLWHFPLEAGHCIEFIIKRNEETPNINDHLYYLLDGKDREEVHGVGRISIPVPNTGETRSTVTLVFHSESGIEPNFKLFLRRNNHTAGGCSCN